MFLDPYKAEMDRHMRAYEERMTGLYTQQQKAVQQTLSTTRSDVTGLRTNLVEIQRQMDTELANRNAEFKKKLEAVEQGIATNDTALREQWKKEAAALTQHYETETTRLKERFGTLAGTLSTDLGQLRTDVQAVGKTNVALAQKVAEAGDKVGAVVKQAGALDAALGTVTQLARGLTKHMGDLEAEGQGLKEFLATRKGGREAGDLARCVAKAHKDMQARLATAAVDASKKRAA
jgi:hypothetical protein